MSRVAAGVAVVMAVSALVAACDRGKATGDCSAEARRVHATCQSSQDEASCAKAGGSWVDLNADKRSSSCGPSGKPCKITAEAPVKMACSCAIPDHDCSCTGASECAGACYGSATTHEECSQLSSGTCGPATTHGCKCVAQSSGGFSLVCRD